MDYEVVRTIEERFSVRSYTKRPMPAPVVKAITNYANKLNHRPGPFGTQPRIVLARTHLGDTPVSTYGVIRNASEYFVGICQKNRKAIVDFGYNFEQMVLYSTSMGLGTCWLAGTFKREDFEELIPMESGEYIPAISPVGYTREKTSFLDESIRFMVRSQKRKPWESLFFDRNLNPLSFNTFHHEMKIPLEMVRLAPSGQNRQPWIVILSLQDKEAHFFSKGSFTHLMDLGIAMAHFELAAQEQGFTGIWHETRNPVNTHHEYILSFHWNRA